MDKKESNGLTLLCGKLNLGPIMKLQKLILSLWSAQHY
jgi:hypothetical protein